MANGLLQLKADTKRNMEQLGEELPTEMRVALENLWAWNEQLIDVMRQEMFSEIESLGAAVDELIGQSENVLHPELTAKIVGVFETGKIVAMELEKLAEKVGDDLDDMAKRRIAKMVDGYRKAAHVVTIEVSEVTLEMDELLPDDEEDDGDEDTAPPDDGEGEELDDAEMALEAAEEQAEEEQS